MTNHCPNCHGAEDDYQVICSDDAVSFGDILEDGQGLAIVTPYGVWGLSTEEAINLNAGLSAMLLSQLTRPWSDEDRSTVISRGTRRLHTA